MLFALNADGIISLKQVNERILFFSALFVVVDKKNMPCHLNKFKRPGEGLSPKPGAAKMWCLLRFLPLMLSDLIEVDNKYWKLFVLFQEIADIIFSPVIYESTLLHFEELYADFLSRFKALFPRVNIKPKYHFLVHFRTMVRNNGPPKTYWVFNYERMNGAIKIPSRVMNNFKNPAKTLAYRRQSTALHHLLENKFHQQSVTYGAISIQPVDLTLYDFDEIIYYYVM